MKRTLFVYLAILTLLGLAMAEQPAQERRDKGGKRRAPLSIPVRDMPLASPGQMQRVVPLRHRTVYPNGSEKLATPAPAGDAAAQTQFGPNAPTISGANLSGIGQDFPLSSPIAAPGVPGASRTSNVVTITTTLPLPLTTGQQVVIAGVSDASFNGTFSVSSVPTATTFTYAQTAANATSGNGTASGTFTVNSAPPDTDGAVGRTQYIQLVNTAFAVFDKSTQAVLAGPTNTNNLWSTLPASNPCNSTNDGDGIVLYDHLADRWIITQFANAASTTGPFYECVAISQTGDAAGQYFLYFFDFVNTNGTTLLFNDYPKVGVWPDAYYFSYNGFTASGSGVGAILCALDRSNMLLGAATLRGVAGPAGTASDSPPNTPAGQRQVCFVTQDFGLLPSDLDGATSPPAGSPNYFVEWFDSSHLGLWKFHVDFNTLTNSTLDGGGGPIHWVSPAGPAAFSCTGTCQIAVTAFTPTCNPTSPQFNTVCVPQSGTSQKLDSLSDRVMHRLAYRNFGSHESLVTNHSVQVGGTGSGIRWYEIQNPNGTPTVAQQGTWAPDSSWRWMGSAAMDKFGNLAIGYSVSSSSINPAIRYAARLSTDTPGTLGNETSIIEGTGSQTTTLNRWGDYSALSVDPQDDCTFWYTNEYLAANGTFNWQTRIGSFRLAQCQSTPSNISVTPDSGSGSGGVFSFLYADTGGASLITTTQGLFNASNSLTSACAFQYNPAANTLQIFQDNGALNPTTITPGSGTLSNSQCTINGVGSSAGTAGNSLIVNLSVTFTTPAFDGSKNIYMNVSDTNGTTTGFQQFGIWTVQ